tara:strand:+ start:8860 stop:10251 length:1392 start_codon:yes stop_codon:yes gene_type:complete
MIKNNLSFLGVCLVFFIIMMDTTIIPLLYPTLLDFFNIPMNEVIWINSIYLAAYTSFMLLGGKLGDFFNRKKILQIGTFLIIVGSCLCIFFDTFEMIILGRGVIGLGAALSTPQSMASLSLLFTGEQKIKAFSVWAIVAGIGTASGPLVSELFLYMNFWKGVFAINIPIALCALFLITKNLKDMPGKTLDQKDLIGTLIVGIVLTFIFCFTYFYKISQNIALITLTISLIFLFQVLFNDISGRSQFILTKSIYKNNQFIKVSFISSLLGLSLTSFYLPMTFLVEKLLNFNHIEIISILLNISLFNSIIGHYQPKLSKRLQPIEMVRYGFISFSVGLMILTITALFNESSMTSFCLCLIAASCVGIGTGLSFAPLANLALSNIDSLELSRASAFFNTSRLMMSTVGCVLIAELYNYMTLHNKLIFFSDDFLNIKFSISLCFVSIFCALLIGIMITLKNNIGDVK